MKDIYQHFRKEEKDKIDMFRSKFDIALRDYYSVLLDFLDPREVKIIESISGGYEDLNVHYYGGGNDERERVRAIIAPSMFEVTAEDFEITVYEMKYPDKFVTLSHRNVLGALMNVGVDRSKIGDVVVGDKIQFSICTPYKDLFKEEMEKVKRAPVNLIEISHDEFSSSKEAGQTKEVLSSSMRLDALLSKIIGEARAKSKERIDKGKLKVNHTLIEDPSFLLEVGDVVSVRHFGRFKVLDILGETKKGKHKIQVELFVGG